jgi:hypothetical protein
MKKGMVFTLDLMFSLAVFTVILLVILWVWGETHMHVNQLQERESRRLKAMDVSEVLVKTMGDPEYWEEFDEVDTGNTYSIGLASDENVLDEDKLVKLNNSNYSVVRTIMGFSREDFNITIVRNWSGVEEMLYSIGRSHVNATERSVIRRYALFNNSRVEFRLEVSYDTVMSK